MTAAKAFAVADMAHEADDAKPSAWNIEAGYSFDLAGYESTAAIGYQQTKEASDVELELPEKCLSVGLSMNIAENTALNLEWAQDKAYEDGNDTTSATAQLAVEF